ncbi:MAG: hypothetical protein ABJH28_07000 [Paraglaciecola sp.]
MNISFNYLGVTPVVLLLTLICTLCTTATFHAKAEPSNETLLHPSTFAKIFEGLPQLGVHTTIAMDWMKSNCRAKIESNSLSSSTAVSEINTCKRLNLWGIEALVKLEFNNSSLTLVQVESVRALFPSILSRLQTHLGEAKIRGDRIVYYPLNGIALDIPSASITLFDLGSHSESDHYFRSRANQSIVFDLSRKKWLEDLATLDQIIRSRHVNPFWLNNETGYEELYRKTENHIQQSNALDPMLINAHFESLVAYIGDGHSYIAGKPKRFGRLPLRLRWFGRDLVVLRAPQSDLEILGATIERVNGVALSDAIETIKPYIPIANASSLRARSEYALTYAGILYAAGLSDAKTSALFTFKLSNGQRVNKTISIISNSNASPNKWFQPKQTNSLLSESDGNSNWIQLIDKQYLYVRYGMVHEHAPGAIATLASEIVQLNTKHRLEKIIVDVRDNEGGNSYLNSVLLNTLSQDENINKRGKLFLLVNRHTFSAAINFSGALEWQTAAIIVGEAPGDRPIFAGEAGPQALYELPHSKLLLNLSFSEWVSTAAWDSRHEINVDFKIASSFEDYSQGRDQELTFIFENDFDKAETTVNKEVVQRWLGHYQLDDFSAMSISWDEDWGFFAEIPGTLYSRLYCDGYSVCQTDIHGMTLERANDSKLTLKFNGETINLTLLSTDSQPLMTTLINGDLVKAKRDSERYIKRKPKDLRIQGNNLGIWSAKLSHRYANKEIFSNVRTVAEHLYGIHIESWEAE